MLEVKDRKILCITNDFGPRAGGIETFLIGLIERLPGSSVIVYCSQQGDTQAYDQAWLKDFGVEVIRDRSKILLPSLRVGKRVRRLLRERQIETVFFGAAAPLALLSHGLRRAGARRIIALTHGHEVWWSKIWPFSLMLRRIGSGVDHLTYLGEFTRGKISSSLTKSQAAAMVKIAPGIDTNHFAPPTSPDTLRSELGLLDKKVVLCVGRLVHRKGQDVLIDAMAEISKKVSNAHLVLIGEGPYRKDLENRARKAGVTDRITFIGRIRYAELPRYIAIGDIFAMPARSRFAGLEVEGLGIVYLEASACGLPVVGGDSGGAPDAVLHGETGLVVDGRSESAVAKAITELFLDPKRAKEMGTQGRIWVEQNWNWQLWAERFKNLLLEDQPSVPR